MNILQVLSLLVQKAFSKRVKTPKSKMPRVQEEPIQQEQGKYDEQYNNNIRFVSCFIKSHQKHLLLPPQRSHVPPFRAKGGGTRVST